MCENAGRPFHGEFSSADASALSENNSRVGLYGSGSLVAVTLAANEQVLLTDLDIVLGDTALTVTVYDGADTTVSAGEQVFKGSFAANGGISSHLQVPHACQVATYPKVKTSAAGQVEVTLRGVIVRHGQ